MINGKSDVKISLKYQNRDRRRDSDILLLVDNLLKINSPENGKSFHFVILCIYISMKR